MFGNVIKYIKREANIFWIIFELDSIFFSCSIIVEFIISYNFYYKISPIYKLKFKQNGFFFMQYFLNLFPFVYLILFYFLSNEDSSNSFGLDGFSLECRPPRAGGGHGGALRSIAYQNAPARGIGERALSQFVYFEKRPKWRNVEKA
jgi:hypothetical protein